MTTDPCGKCGQVHVPKRGTRPCMGHISTGRNVPGQPAKERVGEPCTRSPNIGQQVCYTHGGNSGQAKAAAKHRVAEEKVLAAVQKMIPDDIPQIGNLYERLMQTVAEQDAFREALRQKVNDLTSLRYTADGSGTEQIRAEVTLYERAVKATTDGLVTIAKLDLDERWFRLQAAQVQGITDDIRGAMGAAGIPDHVIRKVMADAGRRLARRTS